MTRVIGSIEVSSGSELQPTKNYDDIKQAGPQYRAAQTESDARKPSCPDQTDARQIDETIQNIPQVKLGGMQIAIQGRVEATTTLIDIAVQRQRDQRPPAIITSANGQVLSLYARDQDIRRQFDRCDLVHADGMSMVFASYLRSAEYRLPERVATTDLFHDVAREAIQQGLSFYILGGTPEAISDAAANVRMLYPDLNLVGAHHGYIEGADEEALVRSIASLKPSILWIGMGVPREQQFALRWQAELTGVGVIKTSGGLFDFLSGSRSRAPVWMQRLGLEWAYRARLDPLRLLPRYILTNPHAAYLLLTR